MFQHPVQQSLQRTSPQKKKKHLIISGKRDQASFNATEGDLQDVVPQIVKDQNVFMTEADNPELKDENKKDKPFSLKIKIAGGLALLILMTILVGFLIVYLSTLMNLKQTQTIKIIMEDNSQSKRTQVQGIQYQWKDEDGYQETAVFSTTTNKQVQNGGRKLQDKSSIGSTTLLPKQMENTFTSISIFCSLTQISVTLTSQSNDAQIFVPINRLIGLLLKYQKRNSIYTRKNFYYDVNKIKKVIQDEKKHSRVTIEQIYERQYNQASKLFQSVTSTNKRTETKRLIQSEQIPRIDNIQSLQAVSLAIREIISVVLSNAGRQFKQLLSTMPSDKKQMLALKSNVYYSPLRDQPSDVQKLCVPMNLNPYVLRCSKSLWNSQALPLSSSSASQQSSPAILISTII